MTFLRFKRRLPLNITAITQLNKYCSAGLKVVTQRPMIKTQAVHFGMQNNFNKVSKQIIPLDSSSLKVTPPRRANMQNKT